MIYQHLLLEIDDAIATITLNRPERLNALNYALKDEVLTALDAIAKDAAVRVLIITGSGRAFCAGADLQNVLQQGLDMDPATREREAVRGFNELVRATRPGGDQMGLESLAWYGYCSTSGL